MSISASIFHKALLTAALFCTVSCTSKPAPDTRSIPADTDGLPLPAVPSALIFPEERAAYLALHFWDALDPADTARSLDTAYMEQSFSNYTTVLELNTDDSKDSAVSYLLDRLHREEPRVYDLMQTLAAKYLYEADSPASDERAYLPFVEHRLRLDPGDLRAAATRDEIMRNAPGTPAPDFTFGRLTPGRGRLIADGSQAGIILFFYEPGCPQCRAVEEFLSRSEAVSRAIADGALRVVAVYAGDDNAEWRSHAATLPPTWETGIVASDDLDEKYTIRATPSLYLINPDGTIALKDTSPQRLAAALGL